MLGMLIEDVKRQMRKSKTTGMEIRGSIAQMIEKLSNLEDNLDWGQALFEKRFEALSFQKFSLDGDNFTKKCFSRHVQGESKEYSPMQQGLGVGGNAWN